MKKKIAEIFKGKTSDILHAFADKNNLPMHVRFFDSDKNIIEPPDDKDISFGWEISDENVVELFHDSRGARQYGFIFIGKAEGQTEIEFFLVKEGRNIFSSGNITVLIEN